ncbi:MAG: thioredoxin [Elusimicrobiota bacterium]|jgi:thioredoxin 1|nr:thioredoxin [Elusimicrobiota bacterium]
MIYLNNTNFENEIKGKIAIVDFFALWCGPCKMMGPIFEELGNEYIGKCEFFKVNIDENDELSAKYSVMSVPTIIIFKNGEKIASHVGALSKDNLKKFVDENLK